MARLLTFSEACFKFGGLVVTGLTIEDAIQEAVDSIYELGRYPGTTIEVELAEEVFIHNETTDQYFVSFDEQTYNGALGFRSDHGGWSIVDKAVLYKDGVNAGDRDFVDWGTVEVEGTRFRKYRAPLGFSPAEGPYYVLLKKEPPVLTGDDFVPIEGLKGLKAAIQAICFEFTGDQDRADKKWANFDSYMKLSERQVEGVKRWSLGMDSSLKRNPRQFQ